MGSLLEARLVRMTDKTSRVSDGVIRAHGLGVMSRRDETYGDRCPTEQREPGDRQPARPHARRRRSQHIASGPTIASARIGGDT